MIRDTHTVFPRLLSITLILAFLHVPTFGKCVNKRFYVERYGRDKIAFERLSADVNANGGGRVIFPKNAIYEISIADDPNAGHTAFPQETSIIFSFRNCKKVLVEMNGSTIKINNNHSSKYSFFFFYNCKSFQINDGFLIGDSKGHDYSPVLFRGKEELTSHQWGYGLNVVGSKGRIKNMKISYMTGDGIRISSYKNTHGEFHAKVVVDGCEISYCRRNGVTIGSTEGVNLVNITVHHIGTYEGVEGTLPQAGIDLEYEDKAGDTGQIIIDNCHFYECTTSTIVASNSSVPNPSRFIISNSTIEGSYFQLTNMQVRKSGEKLVKNCRFINTPINCGDAIVEGCAFEMGTKIHYVHGTTFKDCSFVGQLETADSKYGCCFGGNTYDPASFIKCTFRNVRGKNDDSYLQGFSGYSFKIVAYFDDCEFYNCSFAQGGAGAESNYSFRNCSLSDGCTLHNRSGNMVVFTKSKLFNVSSYASQKGQFSFEKCEIIQDDDDIKYPLLYFGNHRMKACVVTDGIEITPTMKALGVRRAIIQEIE